MRAGERRRLQAPEWPKPGVIHYDITGFIWLSSGSSLHSVVQADGQGLGHDRHVGFMAAVCTVVGAWEGSLEVKAGGVALNTMTGLVPVEVMLKCSRDGSFISTILDTDPKKLSNPDEQASGG